MRFVSGDLLKRHMKFIGEKNSLGFPKGDFLLISTRFLATKNPGEVELDQEIILSAGENKVVMALKQLSLTPGDLRKLADEMELEMKYAKERTLPENAHLPQFDHRA